MAAETTVTGTEGDDDLRGSPDAETLNGLAGNDTILAGAGDDSIIGNGREGGFGDALAGPGDNLIRAGRGDDTVFAGYQADTVHGGRGDDRIDGAGVFASPGAGGGVLASRDLGDRLHGGAGDDRIDGRGGDDTIRGGAGDDTVIGNVGRDALTGGGGADVFQFAFRGEPGVNRSDTGSDEADRDLLTDFRQGEDLIDLSGYRWVVGPEADALFLGGEAFRGDEQALQVRYDAAEGRTVVQLYVPFSFGAPPEVYEIELRGEVALLPGDVVF